MRQAKAKDASYHISLGQRTSDALPFSCAWVRKGISTTCRNASRCGSIRFDRHLEMRAFRLKDACCPSIENKLAFRKVPVLESRVSTSRK
jgi:hypothetical protein